MRKITGPQLIVLSYKLWSKLDNMFEIYGEEIHQTTPDGLKFLVSDCPNEGYSYYLEDNQMFVIMD